MYILILRLDNGFDICNWAYLFDSVFPRSRWSRYKGICSTGPGKSRHSDTVMNHTRRCLNRNSEMNYITHNIRSIAYSRKWTKVVYKHLLRRIKTSVIGLSSHPLPPMLYINETWSIRFSVYCIVLENDSALCYKVCIDFFFKKKKNCMRCL